MSLLDYEIGFGDRLIKSWNLDNMETYHLKRYMLSPTAVEIIFKTGKTLFVSFYDNSVSEFEIFLTLIEKYSDSGHSKIDAIFKRSHNLVLDWDKLEITKKWLNYEISNFEYLMCLNVASGRTNCDLNQFPVLPWVFSQYQETKFKKH